MATFNIPLLRDCLPILKECYGFDIYEISSELTHIFNIHAREKRVDENLSKQHTDENGYIDSVAYALSTDEHVGIRTTEEFNTQIDSIVDLCSKYFEDKNTCNIVTFILVFMATIFNRDINNLYLDEAVEDIKHDFMRNTYVVRPDLLRLFIALNKQKHEYDTPVKICYKTDSPHIINNREGWFSYMLNDYIKQKLGDITIQEAEEELEYFYSDDKGRKSDNPYLNYIINGTYNFISNIIPSENNKVTVEQCRFLLEYLKAIGQVQENDNLANLNTLQSTVKSLINSKHTPVDKHIKRKSMPTLPQSTRVILD